jgi:hypothetical protein
MSSLNYRDITSPLVEPVSLAQAKAQCYVDTGFTADDALITSLITAARQYVERKMDRSIFPRKMQLTLDYFPYPTWTQGGTINPNDREVWWLGWFWQQILIKLPRPGALWVYSITYIDTNGNLQTLAQDTYYPDFNSEPGRIVPKPGLYWPYYASYFPGSVKVEWLAGTQDFNTLQIDTLTVPEVTSPPVPYTVALSQASAFIAGTELYTGGLWLNDDDGYPVDYTFNPATYVLTVASSYAGQTLTAGYRMGNCPQTVCQAMLLLISYWYYNRNSADPTPTKAIEMGVDALLAPWMFDTFSLIGS